ERTAGLPSSGNGGTDSLQPGPGSGFPLFGRQAAATPAEIREAPEPSAAVALRGRHSRDLDRGHYHFGRLAGTRVEGEQVAGLLAVQPWLGAAALEGRLKQECRSPRILHLATHGFFLPGPPRDPDPPARG